MKQISLILAVLFLIVAALYWTGFLLPHHLKHGILAFVLALLCLVWYRFQTASASR